MKLSSGIRLFLGTLLFLLLIWDGGLYLVSDKTTVWHYAFNIGYSLIYLTGALYAFSGLKIFDPETNFGKTLLFFGAGLLSFSVALWIWAYYNLFSAIDVPYPTIADAFFLMQYPLLTIGFYFYLKNYILLQKVSIVLQTIIIFVFISAILIFFQNQFILQEETTTLVKFFNVKTAS